MQLATRKVVKENDKFGHCFCSQHWRQKYHVEETLRHVDVTSTPLVSAFLQNDLKCPCVLAGGGVNNVLYGDCQRRWAPTILCS